MKFVPGLFFSRHHPPQPPHDANTQDSHVADKCLRFALLVAEWRFRAKTRAQLARLSPHQLKDIGLDDEAVRKELAKPFWRD